MEQLNTMYLTSKLRLPKPLACKCGRSISACSVECCMLCCRLQPLSAKLAQTNFAACRGRGFKELRVGSTWTTAARRQWWSSAETQSRHFWPQKPAPAFLQPWHAGWSSLRMDSYPVFPVYSRALRSGLRSGFQF